MDNSTMLVFLLLMGLASGAAHIYTLFCLRRVARKLNWLRGNAVSSSSKMRSANEVLLSKVNGISKSSKVGA